MKKLQLCLISLCVFMLALGAMAQVQNGQFTGTVTDPSGAAVPNAKVTVVNPATNLSVSTTTNQSGLYTVKELPVGTYKITVEASGFKTFTDVGVPLDPGTIAHVDAKMQLGEAREIVEVTGEVAAVNTEDSKLANVVGSDQVANLPLNGRNIYDLIQMSPGAVNVKGVLTENGANTVVNGLREDFNGFTINGVSNKGLSGGAATQPVQDTVQEFQELTLNMSAQYGNSAGSITNLVTKSGTNSFHGSAWEFVRNNMFDANYFFNNQLGAPKTPLHFNQFGATFGGPIIKDKLFFFASYQGDRLITANTPTTITVESPQFRSAVAAANPNSVAALLYGNFAPHIQGTPNSDIAGWFGTTDFGAWLCPSTYPGRPNAAQMVANVIGVLPSDYVTSTCSAPLPQQAGTFDRSQNFMFNTISLYGQQQKDNLFNGNEGSLKLDYNPRDKDRLSVNFNWIRQTDKFGPGQPSSGRGFVNPTKIQDPNGQLSWIHTFNLKLLNELRVGYVNNYNPFNDVSTPGVPFVGFDDGTMGFGSYNGYPQLFKEHIYSYSDMVSINHGNHNMKVGVDFRRNLENSLFDISRPSYYFFDELFFTADMPYSEAAGVNPELLQGTPQNAHLESNVRHWRNLEVGAYFQDDWKASKRLTLNLGLRYDLFTRHSEENGLVTTFVRGPGSNLVQQMQNASVPAGFTGTIGGTTYDCTSAVSQQYAQLAPSAIPSSVGASPCGPGGFAAAKSLGAGDHNDFGPRLGFAYDVFGNGKTSLRGGVGVSYEGTLYNPLSNSRWNLPFYTFDATAQAGLTSGAVGNIFYGPQSGGAPSFTGAADPLNHEGLIGPSSIGNVQGWDPSNANFANLTGIIFPEGIRDPYVYNYFMGVQHEVMRSTVLEVDYVGTTGHKLFRAQDVNRVAGAQLPQGACVTDNLGRNLCSQFSAENPTGRLNPNFATLRVWENVVNSDYNALQASLRHQMSHGISFNINYTWSHAIDDGSTWHSGSTSSNGHAAGEGYTTDSTLPGLDRGNSIYDIRHRLVANYVWALPFFNHSNGLLKNALGGWQYNGIVAFQTGAHWSPFSQKVSSLVATDAGGLACSAGTFDATQCVNEGGDFNLDGVANDRPNAAASSVHVTHDMWATGWDPSAAHLYKIGDPGSGKFFTRPCLGCVGNEGRNTFTGPHYIDFDMSLFKSFHVTERFKLEFRAEAFNVFNHTNFELPGANGATNNRVSSNSFGKAGGTFIPRQLQLGLKLQF